MKKLKEFLEECLTILGEENAANREMDDIKHWYTINGYKHIGQHGPHPKLEHETGHHLTGVNPHKGGKVAETQGTRTMISTMKDKLKNNYISLDDSKRFKNRDQVLQKLSKVKNV